MKWIINTKQMRKRSKDSEDLGVIVSGNPSISEGWICFTDEENKICFRVETMLSLNQYIEE